MLKLTKEQIKEKIDTETDFINITRYGYSLQTLLQKHPNGVDNAVIAKALDSTPEEVEKLFIQAIEKIQFLMKIGEEN